MGHSPGRPVKTRGRPHGHVGRRSSSSSTSCSTPHLMGSSPGRPVKTHGPPHGPGVAAHIEPTSHGSRPGLAHQILRGWAAARPGPSIFQRTGRVPARPTKISQDGPRPDPAHQIFKFHGPARPGPSNFERMGRGPTQPITFLIFHGPARPGPPIFSKISTRPARPIIFSKVLARPGRARHNFQIGPARPGPDKRPMTSPGWHGWNSHQGDYSFI